MKGVLIMDKLVFKFINPANSCEKIYYCEESKKYYNLQPHTNYSSVLCTCSPSGGYYEADTPVKAGLVYNIDGEIVITGEGGEIVNEEQKEIYFNQELIFYRIKEEFINLQDYNNYTSNTHIFLFVNLFEWMNKEHFEQVTYKRKDVRHYINNIYYVSK